MTMNETDGVCLDCGLPFDQCVCQDDPGGVDEED